MDWTLFDHQSPENLFVKGMDAARYRHLRAEATMAADKNNRSVWRVLEYTRVLAEVYAKHPACLVGDIRAWMSRQRRP